MGWDAVSGGFGTRRTQPWLQFLLNLYRSRESARISFAVRVKGCMHWQVLRIGSARPSLTQQGGAGGAGGRAERCVEVSLTPVLPNLVCLYGVLQVMSTFETVTGGLRSILHNFFPLTEEQATHAATLQVALGCSAHTAHLLLQLNCKQLPIEEAVNRSAIQYTNKSWLATEQTFRRRYEFPPQLVQTGSQEGAPSSSTATPSGTPAAVRQQGQPLGPVEPLLVVDDDYPTQAKPFFCT
jgi:hypothetical protein